MNKFNILLLTLFCIISACKKDDDGTISCTISYPRSGLHGDNVLELNRNVYLISTNYSLTAELQNDCTLKIVIKGLEDGFWGYPLRSIHNWSLSSFDWNEYTQTFVTSDNSCDLNLYFSAWGQYSVEYFENGSDTPTITKTIRVN